MGTLLEVSSKGHLVCLDVLNNPSHRLLPTAVNLAPIGRIDQDLSPLSPGSTGYGSRVERGIGGHF